MGSKKLLLILFIIGSLTFSFVALAMPDTVLAGPSKNDICAGLNGTVSGGQCNTGGPSLNNIITNGVNVLSIVVGVLAVVMIMFGGFKYITSAGDTNKITSAKHTILYAIVGLVLVALSQFIVQFVLDKAK